jgi:hypothetical protein
LHTTLQEGGGPGKQDVLVGGIGAGQKPPLDAGGKGGAAAAAQAGNVDLLQGIGGGHFG